MLTDVTPEMTVFREETFGPVVSVYGCSDVDDAVARANDTTYRVERERVDAGPAGG